jgi:hypothetical protein
MIKLILNGNEARGSKADIMAGLYATNSRVTTNDICTDIIESVKKSDLYIYSENNIRHNNGYRAGTHS